MADPVTSKPGGHVAATGQAIGSRYVLQELIGRGASGRVYRATQRDGGPDVAIKLLRDDLAGQPEVVARFIQERQLLRSVAHPHVVRVQDLVVEGDDVLAIVMDLMPDGDLRRPELMPAPLETALALAAQIADGLAAVHAAGVVHCDIKPANVLVAVGPDGELTPRLTDFGVSRLLRATVSSTATMIGSPGYLAPEVSAGKKAMAASDLYGLGVMLYEMCLGRPPFEAEHPLALIRAHAQDPVPLPTNVPVELRALLNQLLDKDPTQRPTAVQAAAAMRLFADSLAKRYPQGADPAARRSPNARMTDLTGLVQAPLQRPVPDVSTGQQPTLTRRPEWARAHASGMAPLPAPVPQLIATFAPPAAISGLPADDAPTMIKRNGTTSSRGSGPRRFVGRRRTLLAVVSAAVAIMIVGAAATFALAQGHSGRSGRDAAAAKGASGARALPAVEPGSTVPATVLASGTPAPSGTGSATTAGQLLAGRPTSSPVASNGSAVPDRGSSSGSGGSSVGSSGSGASLANSPKVPVQSLADAVVGLTYSVQLKATAGTKPYKWTLLSGRLPPGLALSLGGVISGVASDDYSGDFSVKVTDGNELTAVSKVSLTAKRRVGDVNGDGKVNCDDLDILRQDWGTNSPRSDLNGDGTVDVFDLSIMDNNFDPGTGDCPT